ncbi:MAG: hypothetical protein QUV08_12505 [Parasphingorhabdus sp.]|nr:hypothetical protein [Parasphingorhabdus sp.]
MDNALTKASEEIPKWKFDLDQWENIENTSAHGVYLSNDTHLRVSGDALSGAFSLLELGTFDRFERPAPVLTSLETTVPKLQDNGPALSEVKAIESAKLTFSSSDNAEWLAAVRRNINMAEELLKQAKAKRDLIARVLEG